MPTETTEVDRYMAIPYPIELRPDLEQGGFFATHPDLPGCHAQGETADEAVAGLTEARRMWLTAKLERGLPVAEPVPDDFSGRFLLRMSTELHAAAAQLARRRGVSLNLLANTALADFLGQAKAASEVSTVVEELAEMKRLLVKIADTQLRQIAFPIQILDTNRFQNEAFSSDGPSMSFDLATAGAEPSIAKTPAVPRLRLLKAVSQGR